MKHPQLAESVVQVALASRKTGERDTHLLCENLWRITVATEAEVDVGIR